MEYAVSPYENASQSLVRVFAISGGYLHHVSDPSEDIPTTTTANIVDLNFTKIFQLVHVFDEKFH